MTKDPVCGMPVDEQQAPAMSLYQGAIYSFCALGCKAAFERNPEKYIGAREKSASHGARNHIHERGGVDPRDTVPAEAGQGG